MPTGRTSSRPLAAELSKPARKNGSSGRLSAITPSGSRQTANPILTRGATWRCLFDLHERRYRAGEGARCSVATTPRGSTSIFAMVGQCREVGSGSGCSRSTKCQSPRGMGGVSATSTPSPSGRLRSRRGPRHQPKGFFSSRGERSARRSKRRLPTGTRCSSGNEEYTSRFAPLKHSAQTLVITLKHLPPQTDRRHDGRQPTQACQSDFRKAGSSAPETGRNPHPASVGPSRRPLKDERSVGG